jgi:hypothetical protein
MGELQGPEKVNNTCMKTMLAGIMDKGFTVNRRYASVVDTMKSDLCKIMKKTFTYKTVISNL